MQPYDLLRNLKYDTKYYWLYIALKEKSRKMNYFDVDLKFDHRF